MMSTAASSNARMPQALLLTLGMGASRPMQRRRHRAVRRSGGGDDACDERRAGGTDAGAERRSHLSILCRLRAANPAGGGARDAARRTGHPVAVAWRHRLRLVPAELDDFRAQHLRDRQQCPRQLPGRHQRDAHDDHPLRAERNFAALAGIMLLGSAPGVARAWRPLPVPVDRRGGDRRRLHRRRPRPLIGAVAGAITLVTLVSVLMALNMPEYGRSITYGVIILLLLPALRP